MQPQPTLSRGELIDTYWRVVDVLSVDDLACVYTARSGKTFATLRVIHPHLTRRPYLRERFEREAQLVVRLRHPGVINAWGWGYTTQGHLFTLREVVDGETLDALVRRGRLPALRAMEIARDLADALLFLHEQGIIHRDLKPSTIAILDATGAPRLTEFGVAKNEGAQGVFATMGGAVVGTPMYMSPEQARGDSAHVDERSDLFSLGLILRFMLTGAPPRDASSLERALAQALQPTPRLDTHRLGLPRAVGHFVDRLCAFDPGMRFASAGQTLAYIEEAMLPLLRELDDSTLQTIPVEVDLPDAELFTEDEATRPRVVPEELRQRAAEGYEEPPQELLATRRITRAATSSGERARLRQRLEALTADRGDVLETLRPGEPASDDET